MNRRCLENPVASPQEPLCPLIRPHAWRTILNAPEGSGDRIRVLSLGSENEMRSPRESLFSESRYAGPCKIWTRPSCSTVIPDSPSGCMNANAEPFGMQTCQVRVGGTGSGVNNADV